MFGAVASLLRESRDGESTVICTYRCRFALVLPPNPNVLPPTMPGRAFSADGPPRRGMVGAMLNRTMADVRRRVELRLKVLHVQGARRDGKRSDCSGDG